ncbi:MAG TPA: Na-translocating system protein MpsC family protein [Paenalcaligenes hominis]|uniref:Na-translocating system protein MpsC family protein n=1 Tax=Paenalcaligenes hominis TaxID=643674 RepID=A0A9D2VG41_9BURK|nr:Na-translocating system protein MpsC family protein [Paenalcaligenes hominis]
MKEDRFSSIGVLKQALTRDYNRVNMAIFSGGVISLKIDIVQDKILILANHKRVAALDYLSKENAIVSDLADNYLVKSFKKEFIKLLENDYGFDILSLFKDYDTRSELSLTVIYLKDCVESYITA